MLPDSVPLFQLTLQGPADISCRHSSNWWPAVSTLLNTANDLGPSYLSFMSSLSIPSSLACVWTFSLLFCLPKFSGSLSLSFLNHSQSPFTVWLFNLHGSSPCCEGLSAWIMLVNQLFRDQPRYHLFKWSPFGYTSPRTFGSQGFSRFTSMFYNSCFNCYLILKCNLQYLSLSKIHFLLHTHTQRREVGMGESESSWDYTKPGLCSA